MKLSVIMPSNSSSGLIIRALDSLIDLGLESVEYLISLDNVSDEIHLLIDEKKNPNIKVFYDTGTLSHVLNLLVERSSGEYIARADDDDIYLPGRLRLQLNYLESRKDVDVVGAGMYLSKDDLICGLKLYPCTHEEICFASLFECNTFPHPLVMGKKSFFSDLKYEHLDAEDYNLWIRGICKGYKYSNLEIPLMIYSLPNYSLVKENAMKQSVNNSITMLLQDYYKIRAESLNLFLNFFSERNRHFNKSCILSQDDFEYFFLQLSSLGMGRNNFMSIIQRYAPDLTTYCKEFLMSTEKSKKLNYQ